MKAIPGINIQYPWSQLITSGQKIVETRSYCIPKKYICKELAIIETPGLRGLKEGGIKKARIIGTVTFKECIEYKTHTEWKSDYVRHLVLENDSQYKWNPSKRKFGWIIEKVVKFDQPISVPTKRGIIFASECKIPD